MAHIYAPRGTPSPLVNLDLHLLPHPTQPAPIEGRGKPGRAASGSTKEFLLVPPHSDLDPIEPAD
jgi:hypothetical protein